MFLILLLGEFSQHSVLYELVVYFEVIYFTVILFQYSSLVPSLSGLLMLDFHCYLSFSVSLLSSFALVCLAWTFVF